VGIVIDTSLCQHFSFPLSVPFHHRSITIHPPTTHTTSVSLSVSFHRRSITIHPPTTHTTSVSPCQYHSTIAPHSFNHIPPTLYNLFLPVLQFLPISSVHHSSTPNLTHYYIRCVMLATDSFVTQYTSLSLYIYKYK